MVRRKYCVYMMIRRAYLIHDNDDDIPMITENDKKKGHQLQ